MNPGMKTIIDIKKTIKKGGKHDGEGEEEEEEALTCIFSCLAQPSSIWAATPSASQAAAGELFLC